MSDKLEAALHGPSEIYAAIWIQRTFPDVLTEIRRAVRKHGILRTPLNSEMSNADKLVIVVEEIGEIARAATYDNGDRQNLKDELTQAATMLLAWRASLV